MIHMVNCTASTLRAALCYIDAENTPKISYDKDEFATPLIKRLRESVDFSLYWILYLNAPLISH